jgi:hypothetical protein
MRFGSACALCALAVDLSVLLIYRHGGRGAIGGTSRGFVALALKAVADAPRQHRPHLAWAGLWLLAFGFWLLAFGFGFGFGL